MMPPAEADLIVRSLDLVAERVGDPTPLVYQRLFAENPEMEALFVNDIGGLVRGQMFQTTLEMILDYIGDNLYAANLLQIERINHDGKGVPPEVFDLFFGTVKATFRDALGADWTEPMDRAWRELLTGLSGTGRLDG